MCSQIIDNVSFLTSLAPLGYAKIRNVVTIYLMKKKNQISFGNPALFVCKAIERAGLPIEI